MPHDVVRYPRYRFPPAIISHAIWARLSFHSELPRRRGPHLERAIDQDGDVIDIMLQSRRDRHAAARFFRTLLKRSGRVPHRLVPRRTFRMDV